MSSSREPHAAPVALAELEPIGNPRVRSKTLARDDRGGSVVIQVAAVHAHTCPFWRQGQKHGPCDCGALDAWEAIYAR